MIRLASLFWLALVCATGFATFKVKYAVQDFEEELNRVRKQTVVEHQEIHLLRAEWTTLNQPERLADLNRRYLSLAAIAPKQLQGRDWTRYEGLIHTDHAVREEFFADRDEPITGEAPYIEDLTYLYDRSQEDFVTFTAGKPFTEDQVYTDIGGTETWTRRTLLDAKKPERSPEHTAEIALLLSECQGWGPSEDYLESDLPA